MRLMASILILMFTVSGSLAQAEAAAASGDEGSPERHVFGLGIEPHWLLIGGLGVKADAPVTRKVAIVLTGMYIPPRSSSKTSETTYLNEDFKWSTYEVYLGSTIMVTGDYGSPTDSPP